MALWFFQGVNDFISPPLTAEVMYEAFLENYQEAGKSTEWLEDNVRFTYLNDKLYTDMNESSFHSTMKPTYLWYAYYNDELYNATYSDAEDSLGQYFDTKYGDNDPGGYTGMVDWLLSKNKSELDGGSTEQEKTPESLDGKPAPTYDYSDANQLPMTGYFTKTLSYEDVNGDAASREVYIYLSENASCRPYFYVIAVPSGTENVTQFLEERGWFDLADQKGECLFVITAGEGGYGTAEEEMAFMDAAMAWLNTPTADEPDPAYPDKNVNYWSAFGEWYFTGYGDGCAVLEAWAAKNPIFVIAQAYVDGQSVGQDYLDQVGAEVYPVGSNGYNITEDVKERLGGESNMIHRGQIPVPTLFVGYGESDYSLQYWKNANYCQDTGASDEVYGTIYAQASDSEPWQTQYAGPISRVAVSGKGLTTGALFDFLTYYTRYDNTSAYGNALMQRVEYSDVIVACHQSDDLYAEKKITTPDGQTGTMICTVEEINGELREILFYVPDNAAELQPNGAPILTVWAGGSQTNIIFFDSTCWWETANENGIALIFTNEAYNTSVAVSPKDIYECYETMMDLLKSWEEEGKFDFDFTRTYSTGQSMGSMESQQFAQESPEFYAAVASTSFYQNYPDTQSGDPVPTYLINGEGNGTDDTGTPFDDRWNRTDEWAQYFLTVNGFEYQEPVYDDEGNMTEFGKPISMPVESVSGPYNRFETYTWNNANNIPIMQYTNSLYRPHNCLTSEIPMMWDFLEHYRYVQNEDGSITRYYSESAFQDPGDETVIFEVAADKVTDIDTVETAQIDYTQSAQIPLDGWYEKTLESGRTVELYFPEYAACRAYFTVVAIPDGVEDSTVWAEEQGYVELMEQRGEVLVLLKPGADGWGSMDDELAYVTEAMTFVNAGQNAGGVTLFTNYSTFYLVGYGGGAAALEAWAIDNPILVGSQAYVNGTAADADYRAQTGAKTYDGTNTGGYDPGIDDDDVFMQVLEDHGYEGRLIARSEVPVPTWFVGTADEASVDYWKSANDCLTTPEEDVYWQSKDSDAFQTEYANDCTEENHGISQVKVSGDTQTVTAQQLADFLYAYSRYNVPFAYSNHLSERQDYTAVRVEAQKEAQSGDYLTEEQKVSYDAPITASDGAVYDSYYVLSRAQGEVGEGIVESGIVAFSDDNGDGTLDAREYLMYVPDSAVENAPVVFQYPGMTQSVSVGFDSTQWWRVANDYGVIVVILGEAYNNGVALSWKNSDMAYYAVRDILENDAELSAKIDWNRIYGSGHSLGSSQVQGFTRTHPEFFAAVASTSFASTTEGSYEAVPTMLVIGQSDLPFLMDDLWTSDQLKTWFEYLAKSNDLKVTEATPDNADSKVEGEARTWTYTWNNEQDIPMVVWGQTYLREHNCYPAEIPMAWEFMSHYSMDSETGTRYYSESAFEETGDETVIVDTAAECGMTEDDVVSIQATTTPNFYGQRLSQIVITFQEGTDMTGAANVANYKIWDRAFQTGAFEEGSNAITDVSVDGTTVTLTFDQGPANNEPFGMLATVSWETTPGRTAARSTIPS